jgi:RHS repeat-associated protein
LLNDGLGSVRQEMVDAAIESTTTYEPFGNLLVQTGLSGTTYGFTGEQHDAAAGLVYLRARYYNPNLKVFMSRDPFPGWPTLPASQHGYSYVHNNPVNLIDPSGEFVPPALVAGAAACAANPLCLLGGVVVIGAAWVVVGPQVADLLAPLFTDMSYSVERAVGQVARDTRTRAEDFLEQCGVIVETAFQQRSTRIQRNPRPISVDFVPPSPRPQPTPDRGQKRVLTVGDGNFSYSKALANNNPNWEIIGTSYGDGSNSPRFEGTYGNNLVLYSNVDATRLQDNANIFL